MEEVSKLTNEISDLKFRIDALMSESSSLKDVISRVDSQRISLDQTVKEMLNANINLKAGCYLLETELSTIKNKDLLKDMELKFLNESLKEANNKIESLTCLSGSQTNLIEGEVA